MWLLLITRRVVGRGRSGTAPLYIFVWNDPLWEFQLAFHIVVSGGPTSSPTSFLEVHPLIITWNTLHYKFVRCFRVHVVNCMYTCRSRPSCVSIGIACGRGATAATGTVEVAWVYQNNSGGQRSEGQRTGSSTTTGLRVVAWSLPPSTPVDHGVASSSAIAADNEEGWAARAAKTT